MAVVETQEIVTIVATGGTEPHEPCGNCEDVREGGAIRVRKSHRDNGYGLQLPVYQCVECGRIVT